jgi:hypothetical protein
MGLRMTVIAIRPVDMAGWLTCPVSAGFDWCVFIVVVQELVPSFNIYVAPRAGSNLGSSSSLGSDT